ncbi:MAG: GTPase Era [Elusimicrobia bacterium]|nr:GTPase Era [Elusimicrobiota bacterium]
MPDAPAFRSGFISLVGWPNVGKSTLLNALLGTKLSIVSPRPQTTRDSILGILNEPGAQMVFVDTPGWLNPQDTYQAFMKRAVVRSIYDDADLLVWMVEPRPLGEEEKKFGGMLRKPGKPVCVVVNKIDTGEPSQGWAAMETEIKTVVGETAPVLRVSARKGLGIDTLKSTLRALLPEVPAYFPNDQLTDRWERFFVAELIREQIFQHFQQEVPHAAAVAVQDFVERPGAKDHIKAVIFVETEGQKGIMVGKSGEAIKKLGQTSRQEIEARLGRPVFLELTVKLRKDWRKDPEFLKRLQSNDFDNLF